MRTWGELPSLREIQPLHASFHREALGSEAILLRGRTRRIRLRHLDKAEFKRWRKIVICKSDTVLYADCLHNLGSRHFAVKHIYHYSHGTGQSQSPTCRGGGFACRGCWVACRGVVFTCRGRISFPAPYKQKSALQFVFLAHERVAEEAFEVLGRLFNALGDVGVIGANQGIAKLV